MKKIILISEKIIILILKIILLQQKQKNEHLRINKSSKVYRINYILLL